MKLRIPKDGVSDIPREMLRFGLIIVFVCSVVISCKDLQSNDLVFDQAKWRTGDARLRGRMASNIIQQRLLVGKSRDELLQILGTPYETDPKYTRYLIDRGGIEEGLFQKYYLVVVFNDANDTVKGASIVD